MTSNCPLLSISCIIGVQENTQDGYFVGIEIKEVIVTSISMSTPPLIWCEEHFEQ